MIITFEGTNYLREGTFVDYLLNSNILLMYVFSMSHAFVMYVYLRANFSVCAKRRVVSCVQIIKFNCCNLVVFVHISISYYDDVHK